MSKGVVVAVAASIPTAEYKLPHTRLLAVPRSVLPCNQLNKNRNRNTEILANSNREVEGLTLAGQWTALGRIPSKREQSSVTLGHCSHFDSAFKLAKCSNVQ